MLRLTTVDVFTDVLTLGNPVAVVHDAQGLDEDAMAAFARWTNLSETTFLLPPTTPDADYRLRIFTVGGELPFAGHPTIGSARAWLEAGGVPRTPGRLVQECGAGLVPLRIDGERLAFAAPPLTRSGPVDDAELGPVLAALGVKPEAVVDAAWTVNGPRWLSVLLRSAQDVLDLTPDPAAVSTVGPIGVAGAYPDGSETAFEVRAFFDVSEDPVTGSLNAGLAQWLIGSGRAPERYVASQGTVLRRRGRVHVEKIGEDVWIGGDTVVGVTGSLAFG